MQDILENSCYTFAVESLGEELQKNGWDCPERVELHVWSRPLRRAQFSDESIGALGKSLAELLDSIAHLRHTAVHRIRVSVNRVLQFLLDSERLATLLNDENAAKRIARQRGTLELAVDEIKRNKDFLRFRATEMIEGLEDKIAEMKRLQEAAVEDMLIEDREFRQSAVADLETAIDIKSWKQREEDDAGCKATSEIEGVAESSSDIEIECEKHCGFVENSS